MNDKLSQLLTPRGLRGDEHTVPEPPKIPAPSRGHVWQTRVAGARRKRRRDVDLDGLANLCRQHSSLLAVRAERAQMVAAGTFQQLLRGRDGAMQLNPLIRR